MDRKSSLEATDVLHWGLVDEDRRESPNLKPKVETISEEEPIAKKKPELRNFLHLRIFLWKIKKGNYS